MASEMTSTQSPAPGVAAEAMSVAEAVAIALVKMPRSRLAAADSSELLEFAAHIRTALQASAAAVPVGEIVEDGMQGVKFYGGRDLVAGTKLYTAAPHPAPAPQAAGAGSVNTVGGEFTPEYQARREARAKAIIYKLDNASMRDALEECSGTSAAGMTKTQLRAELVRRALECEYNLPIEDWEQPGASTATGRAGS